MSQTIKPFEIIEDTQEKINAVNAMLDILLLVGTAIRPEILHKYVSWIRIQMDEVNGLVEKLDAILESAAEDY